MKASQLFFYKSNREVEGTSVPKLKEVVNTCCQFQKKQDPGGNLLACPVSAGTNILDGRIMCQK